MSKWTIDDVSPVVDNDNDNANPRATKRAIVADEPCFLLFARPRPAPDHRQPQSVGRDDGDDEEDEEPSELFVTLSRWLLYMHETEVWEFRHEL